MKFKKIFSVFIMFVFLLQISPISTLAETNNPCPPVMYSRLEQENMILTRTSSDLSPEKCKCGDTVKLNTMEDIVFNNNVIIPCGSTIEGTVIKSQNTRIFRADAYIDILITKIYTSSCCMSFQNSPIKLRLEDPRAKSFAKKIIERAPIQATNTGTSIALSTATDLAGGVIFAITVGAATAVGLITGYIYPDIDKTRLEGSITRGIEATPVGLLLITLQAGYDTDYKTCSIITIRFNNKIKQQIASTYWTPVISSGCVP